MRVEHLVESQSSIIELSSDQAEAVAVIGRRFSSSQDQEGRPRSAVECEPYGSGSWRVRVPNAIGVIAAPDVQLVIEPKIPLHHLMYLFDRSNTFPRTDAAPAHVSSAEFLWPLLARWYVQALERLIHAGLASDYLVVRDETVVAKGRIRPLPTARRFLQGKVEMSCEYEEFSENTPMNRVIKAAALAIARSPRIDPTVRQRARQAIDHLPGVETLDANDVRVAVLDRQTTRYGVPLQLARQVLLALGPSLGAGDHAGNTFLIRTPDMVEEALRRVVVDALDAEVAVAKSTRFFVGSHHSMTPDLAFGGTAVGDVKYKIWGGDWNRNDLYQLVAFATAFEVDDAIRLGFAASPLPVRRIHVGGVALASVDWSFGTESPDDAELQFATAVRSWWSGIAVGNASTRKEAQSSLV